MVVDQNKLQDFLGKAVGDIGAAMSANLVLIGDRLGLYKAMAKLGPVTPAELAKATKTAERYVREWLANQAAGGYVAYDAATGRFTLPPEQALALADETSPCFLPGAFHVIAAELENRAALQDRQGPRLGRTRSSAVRGDRAILPAELRGQFGEQLDPGARRRRGQA